MAAAAAERKSTQPVQGFGRLSSDYGAWFGMKLVRNIVLTPEAEKFIKQHYIEPDVVSCSELQFIPRFIWVIAYKDADWKIIEGTTVGYELSISPVSFLADSVVSSFDGRRKFFAVEFDAYGEKYDPDAQYLIEHFEDINYIIKQPKVSNRPSEWLQPF